ncbi:MAG: glycosyltransferase family 39 protein [Planctomycetota bacterium]
MLKKTWFQILLLVLLSGAVRAVIWSKTDVISSDGPLYIEVAQYYYEGNFKQALSHPYHPLYPFLMSLAYRLVNNWEWAGMLISVIFSALAVIPLYLLGRKLFNPAIALITGLLYAFHPTAARLSAGILTPGIFIFLVTTSVWLISEALDTKKYRFFILAGAGTLLCFAARPDGAVLLPVFLGVVIFNRSADQPNIWKAKILALVLLMLPWLLMALPYLIRIKQTKGEWDISNKGLHIIKMLNPVAFSQKGWEAKPESSDWAQIGNRYIHGVLITVKDCIQAEHLLLLFLLIIGVLVKKQSGLIEKIESGKITGRLVSWLAIVWLLVMLRFAIFFDRLSKRYTVILAVITIFWAAAGLVVLAQWINKRFRITNPTKQAVNLWVILALILAIFSINTFKAVDYVKLNEKTTGEWIKNYHDGKEKPKIMSDSNRIPYYAGGSLIHLLELDLVGKNYSEVISRARTGQVDYLVVDNKIDHYFPGFTKATKKEDLRLIYTSTASGKTGLKEFRVYRVVNSVRK